MNSELITKVAQTLVPGFLAMGLGGCGQNSLPKPGFPIEVPATFEGSPLRSEAKVLRIHGALSHTLGQLRPTNCAALSGVLTEGFTARFGDLSDGRSVPDSEFEIQVLDPGQARQMGPGEFQDAIGNALGGWRDIVRRRFELDRFYLDPSGERAVGRAEIYLAGSLEAGGRADVRWIVDVVLEDTPGGWCLSQLDLVRGTGIRGRVKPFVDITESAGFSLFTSKANREMLQSFVDEHRVLALGGLTALDWNDDGFMDVLVSIEGSLSTLLMNDGQGGFLPRKTPIDQAMNCGVFALHLDLDGDGKEELVSSRELAFSGETGHFGLFTQTEIGWEFRPEAFEFANPVGVRGIKVQTIVPFDANGDGLMDLFFGVYGTQNSRGDNYNLVEAHDGGNNHLFINQGNLQFREETIERGLSGVQYTYVALPYDFDGDGDVDLFEGNDFGRNHLWLNDGNGYFSADADSIFAKDSSYTMGITLADHDDDGWPSLYVVNMSSEAGERLARTMDGLSAGMRQRVLGIASGNYLYNLGPGGEWKEQAAEFDCAEGEWGWGAMFCDLDGDGDDEIFATNGFTSHHDPSLPDWDPYFWRQVAMDGVFLERGMKSVDVNADSPFEGSYAGYQRNRLFYKADGDDGAFYDAAWHYGLDNLEDARCCLPLDIDGDGDLDLALYTLQGLRLYQNQSAATSFLRLRLQATQGHASAQGAKVRVKVGDHIQHDTVQLVEGFQTQHPADLSFAWERAESVEEVHVRWPSGTEEVFKNPPLGKRILLTEGRPGFESEDIPTWSKECAHPGMLAELNRARPKSATATSSAVVRVVRFVPDSKAPWTLRDALADRFPTVKFETADWAEGDQVLVYDLEGELARAFFHEPGVDGLAGLLTELEEEPWFSGLALLTGRRLLDQGEARQAEEFFHAALAEDPRSPAAAEGLARARRLLGDPEGAEGACLRAIEIDPDYAIGHFNLAVLRLHAGNPELALVSYQEVLRIRGEDRDTLLAMGEAALLARDRERALGYFQRASLAAPGEPEPHVLLGKILGQMGRLEAAISSFTKAVQLDPGNQDASRGLAGAKRLLAERGKRD